MMQEEEEELVLFGRVAQNLNKYDKLITSS
jgi:hypothetical protein